jgi:hypothetical protein
MSPSQRTKKRTKKTAPLLSPSLLASVQPPVSSLVRHPWTRAYFVRGVRLGLDARAYVSASVTLAIASFAFEAAPAPKKAPREGFQKVEPSFREPAGATPLQVGVFPLLRTHPYCQLYRSLLGIVCKRLHGGRGEG